MKTRIVCAFLVLCLLLPLSIVPTFANGEGIAVTVDGETVYAGADGVLDLEALVEDGKRLVYAELTHADGTKTQTVDRKITAEAGLSVELHTIVLKNFGTAQARVCRPLGLRFITETSSVDYNALRNDSNVRKVEVGTLIAPADDVAAAGALTHAAFEGKKVLDVPTKAWKWYEENAVTKQAFFAGSIAPIKEHHYNLSFAGCGYVRVTLRNGQSVTVYAADAVKDLTVGSIAVSAIYQMRADGLSRAQQDALKVFADQFEGDLKMLYGKLLNGLNVLAVGDSLFAGAYETVREKVWVNRLGVEYSWNLTNLGIGGATVSYDPNRAATNKSMYQLLMNDPNYCYGSSSYYSYGFPSKKSAEDVDLILLEGGSNDYGTKVQAPQGHAGSKDPATFLGAWHLLTEELLCRYPNAIVVFVTAWENANQTREDGASAKLYTSSVNTLYEELYENNPRVYMIDAGDPKVSGVTMVGADGRKNQAFVSQYAYDIFHLNDEGMELMANSMRPLIWEVLVKDRGVALTEAERMRRDLAQLDVMALGDSLFYGARNTTRDQVWVNILGKECNWNLTNLGIGGATISYSEERNQDRVSIYNMLFNDPMYKFGSRDKSAYYNCGNTAGRGKEEVDLILLQAGSNDYGSKVQAPLGTVGSEDPSTFLGAWKVVTDRLLVEYPNATIVLVTAWENGNQQREDGANAIEFTSSVVGLYEELYADNDRVKLLNAGSPEVSGVDMRNQSFRQAYAYDAFHLNDAGMRLMADNMLPYLWYLLCGDKQ